MLFAYLAELGDVAIAVLSDLNTRRSCSAVLEGGLSTHGWLDAAEIQSMISQSPPQPTCFVHEDSQGTRIDHIILNRVAAQSFLSFGHVPETGIPVHISLQLRLQTHILHQRGSAAKTQGVSIGLGEE